MGWQRRSDYNRRSMIETAMFRYKTLIGRRPTPVGHDRAHAQRALGLPVAMGIPVFRFGRHARPAAPLNRVSGECRATGGRGEPGKLGHCSHDVLVGISPGMGTIHHPDQPELPIVQQIICRRCRGAGEVYYARVPADVVGGKRIGCPECGGAGKLDLAGQLFRYDIAASCRLRSKRPSRAAG
jgi:hypothetical protein